ncbi:SET domain-containing protein 3 [Diatrype stigma]|uniref:SET domain-containing protein 3 n=1 Tax=Diatrype stigma TaxID=117547 RepID=A0AAN9YIH0_9PEZI
MTTAASPKATTAFLHHVPSKIEVVDEEPYTIKCICGFSDDDGNTIYCETCDTWQHIECFYPHNTHEAYREDFAHSCADCKPRPLDHQRAFERQSLRQGKPNTTESLERKQKRPLTKSQKKKSKPSDAQVNGHAGSETNAKQAHDNTSTHQHKKSKSTHRASQSISSQNPKRSPPYNNKSGNPHGHPPSPATTPPDLPQEAEIHNYSSGFMNLYNDDSDVSLVQTNSFASLVISNVLSIWLRDHDKLKQETGCDYGDVFESLPSNIDKLRGSPELGHKKRQTQDAVLHWQYLLTPNAIEKDVPLVELNGQIGIQKNYCEDPENRWAELSSPLPFVFFHPLLPIYIDTRKEGSVARYVRRSCKPNVVLETYLSGGSEYHFWLVSDRKIAPGEQLTIPWDFRWPKDDRTRMLQLLGLGDEDTNVQPEFDVNEVERYQTIANWINTVLSEYGGCACDLRDDCAFVRFYRTYITRTQTRSNATKKKSRKPKTNAVSPTSTGHSRAPSEGQGDDGADNDSGSSRSKPPSRDMTPARQGSFDTLGVLTELTDRDKRKVQMVEDTFRRMEQQPPPRKKKRISDGTGSSATTAKPRQRNSASQASTGVNGSAERRYVDASTSKRSVSRSPASGLSPSAPEMPKMQASIPIPRRSSQSQRPEYCDASVQTDPVEGEWYSPNHQTPKPKKRVVSLAKKLLGNRHRERAIEIERRNSVVLASPTSVVSAMVKMDLDSPTREREQTISPTSPAADAGSKAQLPTIEHSTDIPMADAPPLPSMESNAPRTNDDATNGSVKIKVPDLRVQLPPVPAFDSSAPTPSMTNTPLSATASTAQSPFASSNLSNPFAPPAVNGIAAHPSPVKKKLSLSDYTKSRMNKAAAAKPPGTSLKPPMPASEEPKSPTTTDTVMLDSTVNEKNPDS